MVEVDIDKILERSEQKEIKKKTNKNSPLIISIAAVVLAACLVSIVIILTVRGESSTDYMPLQNGEKCTYNRTGKSPEEWDVMDKQKNINGYVCQAINKIDKETNLSYQDYYCVGDAGIVRVAYSDNFGDIKEMQMGVLPARIKVGEEFTAGKIRDKVIYAKIVSKEKMSTMVGDVESIKVEYNADPYYKDTIWFGKGIGVVKEVDGLTNEERTLISVEK